MDEFENIPVEETEEEETTNEIDYTTYLQNIIDNQELITDNQDAILTALTTVNTSIEHTQVIQKTSYSVMVGLFVLILFIGACKFIKNIF